MDIKYLNYVLEIAKQRNLHRAAEKLYISQPSLSQFLTRLEKELGTPLFIRQSKELVLTEAGQLYVETAQAVVNMRNKLYRDIANLTYRHYISIATTSQWGMRLIASVLPEFKKNHGDVMIEITESFFPSMSQRLKNQEIDICLASIIRPEFSYKVSVLGEEEILMVVSQEHPFSQSHAPESTVITSGLLTNMLQNENFLFTTKGSTTQTLVEELFQNLQFYPPVFGYFDNINAILHLVKTGAGISFVPSSCIRLESGLSFYHLEHALYRTHIIAYRNDLTVTPAIQDLLDSLHEAYPGCIS